MRLCFLPLPIPGLIIINEISQFMKILIESELIGGGNWLLAHCYSTSLPSKTVAAFLLFFFSCSVLDGVFSEAFKISKNVEILISYVHQELSHSLLEQTVLKVDLEIIKIVGKNLKAVGKI